MYKPGQAGLLLSDDDGVTWRRGGYIPTVDEAQAVELNDGTVLVFGRQDEPGDTPMTVSRDGGDTWEPMTHTGLQSVRCQKSVVALSGRRSRYPCVPGMIPGRQYLLASHPTGSGGAAAWSPWARCCRTEPCAGWPIGPWAARDSMTRRSSPTFSPIPVWRCCQTAGRRALRAAAH